MKKFTDKVQRLSQRAAALRQTIESVPPKIAEMREAFAASTGQVQKLRADLVASVSTLRAETDVQLIAHLREIDAGVEVLEEAGCRLHVVELDLGPQRRVVTRLERVDDVDADTLQALREANAQRPAIVALLSAIAKADELAATVNLDALSLRQITVEIGLIPSVRIGWQADAHVMAAPASAPAAVAVVVPEPGEPGRSVFFERRAPAIEPKVEPVDAAVPESHPTVAVPAATPAADWRKGALDRFKQMPKLGR